MYHLIGPPPGAYTGPYPSESEAMAALATGTKFSMPDNWDGTISFSGKSFRFDPDWFMSHYRLRSSSTTAPSPDALMPSAVLWKGTCLIVKVPRDVDDGPFSDVYLIDTQKSEMFGMYCFTQ